MLKFHETITNWKKRMITKKEKVKALEAKGKKKSSHVYKK